MVSRFLLVVAVLLQGCFLLQTPCGKVANRICTIEGEETSCRWLREVPADNKLGQDACEKVAAAAEAYALAPTSVLQKARWGIAAAGLKVAGFVGDVVKPEKQAEVKKAATEAVEAVKQAGEAVKEAGGDMVKAGKKLGDAVSGAEE